MPATLSAVLESANGNLDITNYLDVNEGAGLDPADPQFSNRVFAHSLLKKGGTLALEDLKLRELTLPLKLNATSKDKLTALVREINTIINTPGCELAWSDEGTSVVTYFDLASGQLDPEFGFRMGQATHPWLKAKLRLFVQPLGQIEKEPRPLLFAGTSAANGATFTASVPVMVFHAASPVRGDAPALVEGFIGGGASIAFWSALSVLPGASYSPWLPASSANTNNPSGWKATASSTEGIVNTGQGNTAAKMLQVSRAANVYTGQQRVLVIARRVNAATDVKIGVEIAGEEVGGVIAASGANAVDVPESTLKPIDCGVIAKGSLPAAIWNLAISSTGTVAIAGVVMLPEDTTTWLWSKGGQSAVTFSGINSQVTGNEPFEDQTGLARGAIPMILPAATAPTLALFQLQGQETVTAVRRAYVNVLEKARYVF